MIRARISRVIPLLAVLLGFAAIVPLVPPAAATQRPAIHPARDVAVTYQVHGTLEPTGQPQSATVQMFWTDHGNRLRVQMTGRPTYALIDFASRRMLVVLPAVHRYLAVAMDPHRMPGINIPAGTTMSRAGTATVAGLGCIVWDMRATHGSGSACITADGLVLRARGSGAGQPSGAMEATAVAYGPQPAALFAPPAGFQPLDLAHIVPRRRP